MFPFTGSRSTRSFSRIAVVVVAASCGGDGGTDPSSKVARVDVTAPSTTLRVGQNLQVSVRYYDASSSELTGLEVLYSSSSTAVATVSNTGLVTGAAAGAVTVTATVSGVQGNLQLTVRTSPAITGTSAATLVPGGSGTITGTNFGASTADNSLTINGVPAVITSASSTSITFTVPATAQLPCTATGPAQVALIANGDTALTSMLLKVASERSLAVGESLLLTADADLVCNEFTGTGGKYLITAFNYATDAGVRTSFRLTGSGATTAGAAVAAQAPTAAIIPRGVLPDDAMTRHLRAHSSFMRQERQLARQLGSPHLKERRRRATSGGAMLSQAAVDPPGVGETRTYRMRRTLNSSLTYDEVNFRVVYSGTRLVILEDAATPGAGTMDVEYVKLGQEFDQVMFDQLLVFGDPLVVDSALDNNGRMLALFSPRVNAYTVNGVTNRVLGFVTVCDFFTRDPITIDGVTYDGCPSSNEGEAFYALIPDPSAGWSISLWRRLIRGTLIHEAKHVASYAWRYFYDASVLEETWLEEATAQQASEIWARTMYARGAKQDIGWSDGPNCDYAPAGGACPDPAEGILHHFGFLYDHYSSLESKSILDDPSGSIDPVIYGSSWSFMRYVTDTYGQSEPAFLSSIMKVQNDHGVANVVSKTGRPFAELLGMFSLASTADNYPNVNITDPRLRLASWNSRDLFANMSAHITDGTSPIFPLPWPLRVRQVSFGNFDTAQSGVDLLRGGGFAAWELSGTQAGPQALAIRSLTGATAPPLIGMSILRIQ